MGIVMSECDQMPNAAEVLYHVIMLLHNHGYTFVTPTVPPIGRNLDLDYTRKLGYTCIIAITKILCPHIHILHFYIVMCIEVL